MLVCAFPAGMAAQLRLGARLQSDGFYYFAHLRSLWFDRDQDLTNDYRLLGMGDKAHLFTPTSTGPAQSAWTIGPAIVWAPFFAVGDRVAAIAARVRAATWPWTARRIPYRQAVCVAGLCWGLHGPVLLLPAEPRCFAATVVGGVAHGAVATGSFLLWYLVKEPTMTHAPSMAAVAGVHVGMGGDARRAAALAMGGARPARGLHEHDSLAERDLRPAAGARVDRGAAFRRRRRAHAGTCSHHARERRRCSRVAAVVGFVPQMLVWKAIYGQLLAVSPIGPQIRWWDPRLSDILWSSRNGLFATSPVLYVGALGSAALLAPGSALRAARRSRPSARWCTSTRRSRTGGAARRLAGRRFDGTLPLLVVGDRRCRRVHGRLRRARSAGGRRRWRGWHW